MNRFLPDPFIPAVLLTLLLATLWPATGAAEAVVGNVATAAVMLLFFLHRAKLPRENLLAAAKHNRYDEQLKLVDQPGLDCLCRQVRASHRNIVRRLSL